MFSKSTFCNLIDLFQLCTMARLQWYLLCLSFHFSGVFIQRLHWHSGTLGICIIVFVINKLHVKFYLISDIINYSSNLSKIVFYLFLRIYKVWLNSIYQLVHLRYFTLYGLYMILSHICTTACVVQCHVLYISMYFLFCGLFHVLYFMSRPNDNHICLISSFRWFGNSLLYSHLRFHVIRYRHNDKQFSLFIYLFIR